MRRLTNPLCPDELPWICDENDEDEKTLAPIYHHESIFNSNDGQKWMWGEERPAILPKTKGSGIMVSDFIDEHNGYLCLTNEEFKQAKQTNADMVQEAKVVFEYGVGKDGYWTGDRFMHW